MQVRPFDSLAQMALPVAAMIALATYSGFRLDAAAAAESGFLALLVGAVLLPVAAVAPVRSRTVAMASLLVVAATWVIPTAPTRGWVVSLILIAGAAISFVQRVRAGDEGLSPAVTVPAALAVQMLFRSDLLLDLSSRWWTLPVLVGLPLVAGLAVSVLASHLDRGVALIAAATIVLLGPGWTAPGCITLAAFAAADWSRLAHLKPIARWAPLVLAFLAGFLTQTLWGLILGLALFAYRAEPRVSLGLVVPSTLAFFIVPPPARVWVLVISGLALTLLLLPALPTLFRPDGREERHRDSSLSPRQTLMVGLLLLLVSLRTVPGDGAWMPPVLLLALSLKGGGIVASLQRTWFAILTLAAMTLAAYPWLRADPVAEALHLFGLEPDLRSAAILAVLFLLGASFVKLVSLARPVASQFVPITVILVAAMAAFASLPAPAVVPIHGTSITATQPRLVTTLDRPQSTRSVTLDSNLSNAVKLADGTPVANVRVVSTSGEYHDWVVRVGTDTSEWAARRPDVAEAMVVDPPPAWLSWVAPQRFFAQSYRTRLDLPDTLDVTRIEIERRPELGPATPFSILHLELRP